MEAAAGRRRQRGADAGGQGAESAGREGPVPAPTGLVSLRDPFLAEPPDAPSAKVRKIGQ